VVAMSPSATVAPVPMMPPNLRCHFFHCNRAWID
jgi:hypothetical protein